MVLVAVFSFYDMVVRDCRKMLMAWGLDEANAISNLQL
jgi:hypothetical protein